MTDEIGLIVLAKSRRLGGMCIAGRLLDSEGLGPWARPLGSGDSGALTSGDCGFQDGTEPSMLDVVKVPVHGRISTGWPQQHQSENWKCDTSFYWTHEGKLDPKSLANLIDPVAPLWIDGHSTSSGVNDKIPSSKAAKLTSSLRLIVVDQLTVSVFLDSTFRGKKMRVQGRFEYLGIEYRLWITDSEWENYFLSQGAGSWVFGRCYLTISLSEFFYGASYKLIAGIARDGQ
jgi:hypothetical protein